MKQDLRPKWINPFNTHIAQERLCFPQGFTSVPLLFTNMNVVSITLSQNQKSERAVIRSLLLTVFCPYPRLLECLKATHSPNVKTLSVQVWPGQCWNPRRPLSRPALSQVAVFSDEIGDSSVYSRFQAFRFKLWGHHKDLWQWRETQLLALWLSSSLHYEHRPATGWQVLKRRGCKSPDSWKA